tara:strand:- start:28 stop:942 length:915 start_codon:yes stop_codon:yes gene_type:complete
MAQKFYNDIDLQQLELLNGTIENQTTDANAGTGVDGQLYFNTTDKVLKVYDEALAAWKQVGGFDGALIYQGGYDALNNIPNLDDNVAPAQTIAVEKGWTYTVTSDGLFFNEQVRVGDLLISEIDQAAGASAFANWTTVQNNIDLADLATVGIGNVNAPLATDLDTLGISVAYAAGTATVGLDITGLAAAGSIGPTALDATELEIPVYNSAATELSNQKLLVSDIVTIVGSANSYAIQVTPVANTLDYVINHALDSEDVVVQIYLNNAAKETIFVDVERTDVDNVTVKFGLQPDVNTDFTVLVQK